MGKGYCEIKAAEIGRAMDKGMDHIKREIEKAKDKIRGTSDKVNKQTSQSKHEEEPPIITDQDMVNKVKFYLSIPTGNNVNETVKELVDNIVKDNKEDGRKTAKRRAQLRYIGLLEMLMGNLQAESKARSEHTINSIRELLSSDDGD